MTFPELYEILATNRVRLSDLQKERFETFYLLLMRANKEINLISRKETDVMARHFLNSALVACVREFTAENILDIGSGGGFPGIILATLFPQSSFVLCDSIKKKCVFLENTASELGLTNVTVEHQRVEKLKATYDGITSRAVAKVDEIVDWTRHLLKPGGEWVFWKGRNYRQDLDAGSVRIHELHRFHLSQDGVIAILKH